jgi:hypothetical protein
MASANLNNVSGIAATSLDMTPLYTAADTTDLNAVRHTGRIALFAKNTDSSSHSVTVSSVKDSKGRTGDLVYSIAGTTESCLGVYPYDGWVQADGNLYFSCTSALVSFLAIALP